MKEAKEKGNEERLLSIAKKLNVHSNKVRALVNGFETAQTNDKGFSLSKTFYTTTTQSLTRTINSLVESYERLRREVREVAQIGYVSFENSFPELNINFETYYSVAASLLNLSFQMQLLELYCYHILKR
ncbi:MAG: hypothetical protein NWE84_09165 [Candidatus Bathyarchaeota archaeon]|nr:hypothetical protein [Candidatus Bathyarchaeota archaeon]